MALKKIIDVGVAFPVRKPRLGPAPPRSDVLDNVGSPDPVPPVASERPRAEASEVLPPTATPAAATAPRCDAADGRGVHSGPGIDARRRQKTGRDHQFGARTTLAFADEVKRLAAGRGITIGELLDDMLDAWRSRGR